MATIAVRFEDYDDQGAGTRATVEIGAWEGQVHMDARGADSGYPSMTPDQARALAAVLVAQADEAER